MTTYVPEESGSGMPLDVGVYRGVVVGVEESPSKRPDWPDQVNLLVETPDELERQPARDLVLRIGTDADEDKVVSVGGRADGKAARTETAV